VTAIKCPVCRRTIAEVLDVGEVYIQVRGFRVWLTPSEIVRCFCPNCKTMFQRSEVVVVEQTVVEQTCVVMK
jgi:hypothetical protein